MLELLNSFNFSFINTVIRYWTGRLSCILAYTKWLSYCIVLYLCVTDADWRQRVESWFCDAARPRPGNWRDESVVTAWGQLWCRPMSTGVGTASVVAVWAGLWADACQVGSQSTVIHLHSIYTSLTTMVTGSVNLCIFWSLSQEYRICYCRHYKFRDKWSIRTRNFYCNAQNIILDSSALQK